MTQVLHHEATFRRLQIERLVGGLKGLYQKAEDNWLAFQELAEQNFPEAIKQLPKFIDAARNVNSDRAFTEAIAGGPNQDWIVPLFNVLGDCYATLDKECRTAILRHCIHYFDSLRYDYSQNHVEGIESPYLVADIIVNRGLYWPGLSRAQYILGEKTVEELEKEPREKLESFWIALTIIWNTDCGKLPVRQWYYKNFPDQVEGAISYIATTVAVSSHAQAKKDGGEWRDWAQERLNKRFDTILHDRIRMKMEECSWIEI